MEEFDNKTVVRRFIEQIENTGDISNIREFISEDYVEVYESKRYQIGMQGAIDHVLGVRRVYQDYIILLVEKGKGFGYATAVNMGLLG